MPGDTKHLTPLLGELLNSSCTFLADVGYQHRPVVRVSMDDTADAVPMGVEGAFDAILAAMSSLFFDRIEFVMRGGKLEYGGLTFRSTVVGTVFRNVTRVHVGLDWDDGHTRKYLDAKQLAESVSIDGALYEDVLTAVRGLSWCDHLYDERTGTPPKLFSGDKVDARIHRDAVLSHSDALMAMIQEGLRALRHNLPSQICLALSARKSWWVEESVSHGEE